MKWGLFALLILGTVRALVGGFGWDVGITCACLKALSLDINPYYVENIKQFDSSTLSCTYHTLSYYFLYPICWLEKLSRPVAIFFFPILLLFIGWKTQRQSFFDFSICLIGAFAGQMMYIKTGNLMTALEVLGFLFLFLSLAKGRILLAGVFFGFAAYLKLSPFIYFPAFLAVFWVKREPIKLRQFLIGTLASFGVLVAASFLLFPEFFTAHYQGLFGLIPNQHTPIGENHSGGSNPTLYLVIRDFLGSFGLGGDGLSVIGVVTSLYLFRRYLLSWSKAYSDVSQFAFLILTVSLISPRTKPYFYWVLAIALYFLFQSFPSVSKKAKVYFVAISSICFLLFDLRDDFSNPLWALLSNYQVLLLIGILEFIRVCVLQNANKAASQSAV